MQLISASRLFRHVRSHYQSKICVTNLCKHNLCPIFCLGIAHCFLNFQGWIAVYLSRYILTEHSSAKKCRSFSGFYIISNGFYLVNNIFKLFLFIHICFSILCFIHVFLEHYIQKAMLYAPPS